MIRATFVMEQHLGHQTYYQNMRRFVEHEARELQASWVPVTYNSPNSPWNRIGLLPRGLRGTLNGRDEVRRGLGAAPSDVLFFNTQVPAVLGRGVARSTPYVVATDITPLQYDELSTHYGHTPDRPGPLKAYKHHVNVQLLRGAAHLLPWSTWTRDSLVRDYGVSPDRITVVAPGVDLSRWTPAPGRAEGPLRILFVGGDLYRKGGETLLKAFRALPSGAAELHLVTRTRIPQEKGVHLYHDMQPNSSALVALYQKADVFVLPSEAEAFGIAAAEATATGLPAIVTPIGGLTDIVIDGESGFLVEPGDVAALRKQLMTLAEDHGLRSRMGARARAHAEQHFDARRNASRVVQAMLHAASRNPIPYTA